MNTSNRPPRGFRFGLGAMMLVMLVASVMGAAGYYLVQGLGAGKDRLSLSEITTQRLTPGFHFGFVLFTVAAPVVLLVLTSLAVSVVRWIRSR